MTLNNFDEFSMLSAGSLAPYVGFTEEEVQKLAEEYHQNFCHLIKRNRDCFSKYPITIKISFRMLSNIV